MLPIYEAIDVKEVINEKVGHTRPWVVLANTPYGLTSFVTKLYTTTQVDQSHCITKEIICNLLAGKFELSVPQCAFIDIPEELSLKLSPEKQIQLDNADHRLKFATVYLNNVNNAIPELPRKYYQKRLRPMEMLYAFDNLIRNSDRGHPKANLLLSAKEAYLIDHECTLANRDIINIDIANLQLADRFTKYHLLFPYLKTSRGENKRNFFNDFSFYLNSLSINSLTQYFNQLVNEGFNDYRQPICNWLNQVKQNSSIFVDKLKGSVQ